jgi:hypothetical protein
VLAGLRASDADLRTAAAHFAACEADLDEAEASEAVTDEEGMRRCGEWNRTVKAIAAITPATTAGLKLQASIMIDVYERIVTEHERDLPQHVLAMALCRHLLALNDGAA